MHVDVQTRAITADLQRNVFENCYASLNGAALYVASTGTKTLSIS